MNMPFVFKELSRMVRIEDVGFMRVLLHRVDLIDG